MVSWDSNLLHLIPGPLSFPDSFTYMKGHAWPCAEGHTLALRQLPSDSGKQKKKKKLFKQKWNIITGKEQNTPDEGRKPVN